MTDATSTHPRPLLLTEPAAALLLSMCPKSLYLLRRSGAIPYVRLGKAGIRYSVSDLHAFIAERRRTETAR